MIRQRIVEGAYRSGSLLPTQDSLRREFVWRIGLDELQRIATATVDALGTAAARVTVLPARVAKDLEYDHVIVVEPAAIVEAEARSLHRLYVVLTRAVSRLDVLHRRPMPEVFGTGRPTLRT